MTMSVAVDGDHAYLACDNDGLQVLDISDPAIPHVVGSYSPEYEEIVDVIIIADTAYTTWGNGLRIIDVTNPLFLEIC